LRVKEFQETIRRLYLDRDRKRGLEKTFMWLVEEVGELAEAIRKMDVEGAKDEIADVVAWTVSVANLIGVDVEKAIKEKYGSGVCPYCHSSPCRCKKK